MRSRTLEQLLLAKELSDAGDYKGNHAIMQRLLAQAGNEFVVDSSRGSIVGLTHAPSGFRLHLPRKALPDSFRALLAAQARPGNIGLEAVTPPTPVATEGVARVPPTE